MEIRPGEVESIKVIGHLYGDEVKLIKTIGGFYVGVGKKSRAKKTVEPLAAGSHMALVAHQIEKEYKGDYQPSIMKSEEDQMPAVVEYTKKLPQEMVDAGYQIYSMTKNETVNFIATKVGLEVVNLEGTVGSNGIESLRKVGNSDVNKDTQKICAVIADVLDERY